MKCHCNARTLFFKDSATGSNHKLSTYLTLNDPCLLQLHCLMVVEWLEFPVEGSVLGFTLRTFIEFLEVIDVVGFDFS